MDREDDLISKLTSEETDSDIEEHIIKQMLAESKNYFGPKEILELEINHWVMQYRYIVLKYLINKTVDKDKDNLDLGLGSGLISSEINKLSRSYLGIDKDPYSIRFVENNFKLNVSMIDLPTGNIEGTYDNVFMLNFLEYIKDIDRMLYKAKELVNVGGKLILLVPNEKYVEDTIDKLNNDKVLYKFKFNDINDLLLKNMFKVKYHTYIQNYSPLSITSYLNKENLKKKTKEIDKDNLFNSLKSTISKTINNKDLFVDLDLGDEILDLRTIRSDNDKLLRASLNDYIKLKTQGRLKAGRQTYIVAERLSKEEHRLELQKLAKEDKEDTNLSNSIKNIFY